MSTHVTALPAGTWILLFSGVAELVAVEQSPCPAFPSARLLTIRPAIGGDEMSVLVPADFEPFVLPDRRRQPRSRSSTG